MKGILNMKNMEYWTGQPIPSPADLPDSEIELGSPELQVDSLPAKLYGKPKIWKNHTTLTEIENKNHMIISADEEKHHFIKFNTFS